MAKSDLQCAWEYQNPGQQPEGFFNWDALMYEARKGSLQIGCLVRHEKNTKDQWVPAESYSALKAYVTPEGRERYEKSLVQFKSLMSGEIMSPTAALVNSEGWLYRKKGSDAKPAGYFSDQDVLTETSEGRLTSESEVWHAERTSGDWKDAAKIKAFHDRFDAGKQFVLDEAVRIETQREAESQRSREAASAAIRAEAQRARDEREAKAREAREEQEAKLREAEESMRYVRLANSAITEAFMLEFAKAMKASNLRVYEQRKSRRAIHGNGAMICFAAFMFFGLCAGYFMDFPYDHIHRHGGASGWATSGAVIFFFAWLYKLTISLEAAGVPPE